MAQKTLSNALAFGIGTESNEQILDYFWLKPHINIPQDEFEAILKILTISDQAVAFNDSIATKIIDKIPHILDIQNQIKTIKLALSMSNKSKLNRKKAFILLVSGDLAITNSAVAYLKLFLYSYRHFTPNLLNIDNIFNHLPNNAWSNKGVLNIELINELIWQYAMTDSPLKIYSVDKFPPLANYFIPSGVRIANTANVRLGAYLGVGTTIMQAAFINFNAGTAGPAMIEGRVSAGVWIAENSDIGGGASTMGRLSGGGVELVSVGKNCLLGANSGLGIALGDNCIVESGLYLTATSKVSIVIPNQETKYIKAKELSALSNLLFRRNSITGAVECLSNNKKLSLNEILHLNN